MKKEIEMKKRFSQLLAEASDSWLYTDCLRVIVGYCEFTEFAWMDVIGSRARLWPLVPTSPATACQLIFAGKEGAWNERDQAAPYKKTTIYSAISSSLLVIFRDEGAIDIFQSAPYHHGNWPCIASGVPYWRQSWKRKEETCKLCNSDDAQVVCKTSVTEGDVFGHESDAPQRDIFLCTRCNPTYKSQKSAVKRFLLRKHARPFKYPAFTTFNDYIR